MLKKILVVGLLLILTAPVYAKTHKDTFNVPCATLWSAVKDTLRNSGKYGIIGIDNTEMTASYNMGGNLTGKRINSVLLNSKGEAGCELQVQTAFSGLVNNDYGDFKQRIQKSLEKVQAVSQPAPASKPSSEVKQAEKAPNTPGTAGEPPATPKK